MESPLLQSALFEMGKKCKYYAVSHLFYYKLYLFKYLLFFTQNFAHSNILFTMKFLETL